MLLLIKRKLKKILTVDPQLYKDQLFVLILFLWIIQMVLWLLAWIFNLEILRALGLWALSFLVLGIIPIFLSFAIRKQSYIALWLLIFIYGLDIWFSLFTIKSFNNSVPIVYVVVEFVVLLLLWRAVILFAKMGNTSKW